MEALLLTEVSPEEPVGKLLQEKQAEAGEKRKA